MNQRDESQQPPAELSAYIETNGRSFPLGYVYYVEPNHDPYDVRFFIPFCTAVIDLAYTKVRHAVASDRIRTFTSKKYQTAFLPANTEYREIADQGAGEFIAMVLDPEALEKLGMNVFGDSFRTGDFDVHNFHINDDPIGQIGWRLRQLLIGKDPHMLPLIEEYMVSAVTRMLPLIKLTRFKPKGYRPTLSRWQLARVREYVEANLGHEIALHDLAAVVKMNMYNFAKGFRHKTGQSPYQYVLERRIRRSRMLLERSRWSIADVALECGFSSQQHLTNTFRRLLDTTPLQYRRCMRR